MISRFVFSILFLWIVIPPLAGTFFVSNSPALITDWSMYAKPANDSLCLGSLELSVGGGEWSTVDGHILRKGPAPTAHFYRTPVLLKEQDADARTKTICEQNKNARVKWNLACLQDFKEWVPVKKEDVSDCKDQLATRL